MAIRLLTLGRAALVDARGKQLSASTHQLAFLSYLVVQGGERGIQRDRLLSVFWPEADDERARSALRASLYRLRQAVDKELFVSGSGDSVGLDPEVLEADVTSFDAAMDSGRFEEAMHQYGGDFLDGLHIGNSLEFSEWLDTERARLKRRAVGGAWKVADLALQQGALPKAEEWAARARTFDPYSETDLRRHLDFLAATRDRAGLIREYEDFSERLERDLEVQPSQETVEAFERAKELAGSQGTVPAPDRASITASAGLSSTRPWSRLAMIAALAVILLVVMIPGGRRSPGIAPDVIDVVVLPFEYSGDPTLNYLAPGVTDIVARRLGTLEDLAVANGHDVIDPTPGGTEAFAEALTVLGARYYLSGNVGEAGGRIELSAGLFEVDGSQRLASVQAAGTVDVLFETVDALLGPLVTAHLVAAGLPPGAGPASPSLRALEAYIEGTEHLREGRHAEALLVFRRAVREQPDFAWAHNGVSRAAEWTGDWAGAIAAARRTWELKDQLPIHERELLEGRLASMDSRQRDADSLFVRVVERHPLFGQGWLGLAEHRFHWGPLLGYPIPAVHRIVERAANVMPDDADALLHLLRMEVQASDLERVRSLVERLDRLGLEDDASRELDLLEALARHDAEAVRQVVGEPGTAAVQLGRSLLAFAPEPGLSLRGLRTLAAPELGPVRPIHVQVAYLRAAVGMGRVVEARAQLQRIGQLDPTLSVEWLAEIATLPGLPHDPQLLAEARARLEALPVQDPEDRATFGLAPGSIYPSRRLYLEGLLTIAEGNPQAALLLADRIRSEGEDPRGADFRSRTLAAAAHRQLGRPLAALEALGQATTGPDLVYPAYWSLSIARNRYLRARVMLDLGRTDEGLRWLASFPEPNGSDTPYRAMVELSAARAYLEQGDLPAARRRYEAYLRFREEADSSVVKGMERIDALEDSLK